LKVYRLLPWESFSFSVKTLDRDGSPAYLLFKHDTGTAGSGSLRVVHIPAEDARMVESFDVEYPLLDECTGAAAPMYPCRKVTKPRLAYCEARPIQEDLGEGGSGESKV